MSMGYVDVVRGAGVDVVSGKIDVTVRGKYCIYHVTVGERTMSEYIELDDEKVNDPIFDLMKKVFEMGECEKGGYYEKEAERKMQVIGC